MDTLSRLLSLFTIHTSLDIRCELAAPWVLDEPPSTPGTAPFHVIVEGSARVDAPGHEPLALQAGDIVVFPGGSAHRLHAGLAQDAGRDALPDAAPVRTLDGAGPLLRKGNAGAGPATGILCGTLVFDDAARRALLGALPPVMVVRASRADDFPGLHALVRLLQHETADTRPGAGVIVAQLSGALFALLMRAWLAQSATTPGLFAVLADRRLGHALQKMLEAPQQPWTVAELAAASFVSRATFARLFVQLSGMTPADALTQLRMALAARTLLHGERPVGDVALEVGYQSEAAFNRVFKRHYGIGPGGYRRGQRGGAGPADR
ncbi:AraC family transcriptional regulator [uncultured Massilia sp.]|uniref:AraC family transcriptional regulator n=1 Tax=uncultured Massilia sp. TaxID=169973 RepID=UPI0025D4B0E5|nr:AraC family transcriptional regulator [uncultured Massilia sp.]